MLATKSVTRWAAIPSHLKCRCSRPPAVDLAVVARDDEQRRGEHRDRVLEQMWLVRAGAGPAHVGGGVADVCADAMRPAADVVAQGTLNDGCHDRQAGWEEQATACKLGQGQAAPVPGGITL